MSPLGSEPTVVQLDLIAAARAGQVIEYLRFLAQPVHLVGGTVRDLLLGRATRDLDVVVQADALVGWCLARAWTGNWSSILRRGAAQPWMTTCDTETLR
jgi:hypothetical protein